MWFLVYSKSDREWQVSEFSRQEPLDSNKDSFIFRQEAEAEAVRRNSPKSNGHFWSEGDDRE